MNICKNPRNSEVESQEPPLPVLPPVDVRETADSYQIVVDLPGVARDDLDVRVEKSRLQIFGLRRLADGRAVRYQRTFRLGPAVESGGIEARLQSGVLEVTLPKPESMRSRVIQIAE